jgi:hypothetical protein
MLKPWEVARLTPFQVRHVYFVEHDRKTGTPILDEPLGEPPRERTLAGEHRAAVRRLGVTDPDAVALIVAARLRAEGVTDLEE